jgi:hypothetical protein
MFDAPTSQAPSVGGPGMYVIKTDSLGNTDSLEIDTFASQSQSSVSVTPQPELSLKAFPDPITSLTTISFTLPAASQATLTLTDAAGRETPLLPAQYLSSGQHEVTWDATKIPSGVYLCRIEAGGESATRRVVVMH